MAIQYEPSSNDFRLNWEKGLAALACLLILVSGFYLWRSNSSSSKNRTGQSLASLSSQTLDVRHKNTDQVSWHPAEKNADLYDGDSIFTGKNSTADISFKKGTALEVGQETLIVIRESSDGLSV
ncbi:MAG: hypothetical protein EOP09_13755, partial [Proteobacteria bacterium]